MQYDNNIITIQIIRLKRNFTQHQQCGDPELPARPLTSWGGQLLGLERRLLSLAGQGWSYSHTCVKVWTDSHWWICTVSCTCAAHCAKVDKACLFCFKILACLVIFNFAHHIFHVYLSLQLLRLQEKNIFCAPTVLLIQLWMVSS